MSVVSCLLSCLLCVSYGTQIQRAVEQLPRVSEERPVDASSLTALAAFLLAFNQAAARQPSAAHVASALSSTASPMALFNGEHLLLAGRAHAVEGRLNRHSSRRQLVEWAAAGLLIPSGARAFENSLPVEKSKVGEVPRKPGPAPTDIGILKETGNLKPCLDTKPHCFSTASIKDYDDLKYDEVVGDPGYMAPWKFTKSNTEAMEDVLTAIKAYPPGQADIDGGGWKIIKQTANYVYVQYESLKKGFIDDMEFAILNDGELSLRTSSRIGRQDKFVNSKRVNYYAQTLGAIRGWSTQAVTKDTHPVYFTENGVPQSRSEDLRRMREQGV